MELIGTRGVAAATVTAVCAESDVTSRYFYRHFSDRDALLRAVYQQLYAAFQDVIVRAIPDAGAPPEVLAYAPIRALVSLIDNDARVARTLFVESATEPLLRELRSELMAGFTDLVLREASENGRHQLRSRFNRQIGGVEDGPVGDIATA